MDAKFPGETLMKLLSLFKKQPKVICVQGQPKSEPAQAMKEAVQMGAPAVPNLLFIPKTGTLDPNSPTWNYIRSWAENALKVARERNDSINCDSTKTAALRGEIKRLKELIDLPNPKKGLLIDEEEDE